MTKLRRAKKKEAIEKLSKQMSKVTDILMNHERKMGEIFERFVEDAK